MYLLCIQPCVDEGEQGVLVIQIQLGQQALDGHGGHFFTACRVVIDHNQGQRGEEEAAVLQQQGLSRKIKTQSGVMILYFVWALIMCAKPNTISCRLERIFSHLRESLEDVGQHLQHRLSACVMLVVQLGHHKVQVLSQSLPQWVVQKVF